MYAERKKNGTFIGRYKDENGKLRSVGVHKTKEEALDAARKAETFAKGGVSGAGNGHWDKVSLHEYFYNTWKPEATQHPKTIVGYESVFRNYLDPELGSRPVTGVTTREIRRVIKKVAKTQSLHTAAQCRAALGAVFRELVEDEVLDVNPARGVTVKVPDTKPFRPLEIKEFVSILSFLPNEASRTFVRFVISTGLRFGEAVEVRVRDYNSDRRELSITRRGTDMSKRVNGGSRILVAATTKSGYNRDFVVSEALDKLLVEHIEKYDLGEDNLLFGRDIIFPEQKRTWEPVSPGEHFTLGNKSFYHGTAYAYGDGKCRCDLCKAAAAQHARKYRQVRRDPDKFPPMEHLDFHRWKKIWREACIEAGIGWVPRMRDLRHSYATAAVSAPNANIYEVMRRLGHRNMSTTQRYLHRVREAQERAAEVGDQFL